MMLAKKCAGLWVLRSHKRPRQLKALWKMKAAKDAGEEYYDPKREDNILVRNKPRSALWEEHPRRSDRGTGQSSEVC